MKSLFKEIPFSCFAMWRRRKGVHPRRKAEGDVPAGFDPFSDSNELPRTFGAGRNVGSYSKGDRPSEIGVFFPQTIPKEKFFWSSIPALSLSYQGASSHAEEIKVPSPSIRQPHKWPSYSFSHVVAPPSTLFVDFFFLSTRPDTLGVVTYPNVLLSHPPPADPSVFSVGYRLGPPFSPHPRNSSSDKY